MKWRDYILKQIPHSFAQMQPGNIFFKKVRIFTFHLQFDCIFNYSLDCVKTSLTFAWHELNKITLVEERRGGKEKTSPVEMSVSVKRIGSSKKQGTGHPQRRRYVNHSSYTALHALHAKQLLCWNLQCICSFIFLSLIFICIYTLGFFYAPHCKDLLHQKHFINKSDKTWLVFFHSQTLSCTF